LVETLEDRKLMAAVVDIRPVGNGPSQIIDPTVGQVVNFEVWVTITGSNGNITDDQLQIAVGSVLSKDSSGGTVKGNITTTLVDPNNRLGNYAVTNAGATFTGVAERGGKVLLVTVMNPEKTEHNEVYKETARLLDWGFRAAGKVQPVGELVAPKGAEGASASPGSTDAADSGEAGGGSGDGSGEGDSSTSPVAQASSASGSDGSGIGVALGIAGGVVVVLAGGAFLINRLWPLRRR